MARNRKSRNKHRRDALPRIANPPLSSLLSRLPVYKPIRRRISIPRGIEDRRLYSPTPRRPLTRRSHVAKIEYVHAPSRSKKISAPAYPLSRPAFAAPRRVLICVRRKQRKEVLFAKNKAGRRGQRRPKFNRFSEISCKE